MTERPKGASKRNSLFENVDCVALRVEDLDAGIKFYTEKLGLKLLWRVDDTCGLGIDNDNTEVVLTKRDVPMVQFKVESVDDSIPVITAAGGKVLYGPFNIDIGRCALINDPWNNKYCILDMTTGKYTVDGNCNVTGVKKIE